MANEYKTCLQCNKYKFVKYTDICSTCYATNNRRAKGMKLNGIKYIEGTFCIICSTDHTVQWRPGPTCNKCHMQNKRAKSYDNQCTVCNNTKSHTWYSGPLCQTCYTRNNRQRDQLVQNNRRRNNINARMATNLRSRLYQAMKNGQKVGSAIKDLGCSISHLKQHLESLWSPGMDWSNYGNHSNEWNIDHFLPLSKFDLTNINQVKQVCHYTNLRPMWATDNIKKGNKND